MTKKNPNARIEQNDEARDGAQSLLTVQQLAMRLNCSARHVERLVKKKAFPSPVRLGALVRWRVDEIERWISQGCPAVANERVEPGLK